MYKKILVPLDNSELGEKILPQIEDLAKCMNSEIVLITVYNFDKAPMLSEVPVNVVIEMSDVYKKSSEKYLSRVAEGLAAKGLKVSVLFREGHPALEIIQAANDTGCDLIAMATHGRGEIAWVLGSVAEKVASHANLPVLLLRVMEMKLPISKEELHSGKVESKSWGSD
jgi:nucleotide-binding universal stress UspA family protein